MSGSVCEVLEEMTWKDPDWDRGAVQCGVVWWGFKHHRALLQTTCGKALVANVAWSIYVLSTNHCPSVFKEQICHIHWATSST